MRSLWGIGPILAVLSLGYAGLMWLLNSCWPCPVTQWPRTWLTTLGVSCLLVGLPFLVVATVTIKQAYRSNRLVTSGVFRLCRHPLYAAWTVFLVPGLVLLQGNWYELSTPIFMYLILRWLIIREEKDLISEFGEAYRGYQKSVPAILPYGWLLKRKT